MSLLVEGGRIVTGSDDYVADVYIEDETITMIGESLDVEADRVIDAEGMYLLPGCIDPHTHFDMPFGGTITADDFESGQTSCAFGGTTCHIDFANQVRGHSFAEGIETWHEKANGKALIDYGFHIIVVDIEEGGSLEELATLPDLGVTSYKMLLAYKNVLQVDDETLFKVFRLATETGALAMIHGENGDVIDVLVKEAVDQGNLEPRWHAKTRPTELEGEATNRAIQIAHVAGCPLYVVHVTCEESVDAIARARAKGWPVWGETCTQYFFIDDTYLDRPDFEGAKAVFSPPVRDKRNQPILWEAVRTDKLSAISTDHCSFRMSDQKTLGKDNFALIPNGAPGVEDRLLMIHHFGVNEGRITLNRMVELLSTNAAKLFGLYPRKGTIAPGSDADIVIFDPEREHRISARTHHTKADYNLYEGTTVLGAPGIVMVRGNILVEDGELVAEPGVGRFIERARFGQELKPARGRS